MRLSQVIVEARRILQDTNDTGKLRRHSDAEMVGYASKAVQRVALFRPDLFAKNVPEFKMTDDMTTDGSKWEAGNAAVTLPEEAFRLIEVFSAKANKTANSTPVIEADRTAFDTGYAQWRIDTAPAPQNFMRNARDYRSFFLYPSIATAADATLNLSYAVNPPNFFIFAERVGTDGNALPTSGIQDIILGGGTEQNTMGQTGQATTDADGIHGTGWRLPDTYLPVVVDFTVYEAESLEDESINNNRAQLLFNTAAETLGVNLQNLALNEEEVVNISQSVGNLSQNQRQNQFNIGNR